jgi:hypothetical protein
MASPNKLAVNQLITGFSAAYITCELKPLRALAGCQREAQQYQQQLQVPTHESAH